MKTIRTSMNYAHGENPGDLEVPNPDEVSVTVPDMTLTVKEILLRHTRGQLLPGTDAGYYESDINGEFLPDFRTMDMTERDEYLENRKQRLSDVISKTKKHEKVKTVPEPQAPEKSE